MSWGAAAWFWALVGVAALAAIVVAWSHSHRRALGARFSGELLRRVLPRSVRVRRTLRDTFALLGLAAVVIAAAEPLYGQTVREATKRGVDLVLLLDLSLSMDARDVDPSRLERAKREISDLLDLMGDDRVGLVVFAGGAYPRMPLSRDHEALRLLVGELDTSVFRAQGSSIGEAVRVGLDLLDQKVTPADRALVLFSDGEFHDPDEASEAAAAAAGAGVRVYTVGVGAERAPIPLPSGGWLTMSGETVLSQPSPTALRELARATGGAYVPAVVSDEDMRQLYQDEILTTLHASETGTVRTEVWESGYQWPLGVGIVLLLLAGWVGDGRRSLGAIAGLLLAVLVSAPAHAQSRAEGDALYRAGRYPEAVSVFTDLTLERPDDADLWERLGAARYRAKDYDGAARAYDTAARLEGAEGTDAEFSAGNAHYQAGRLEEALERYHAVLDREPDHVGAGQNAEIVEQELAARRVAAKPKPKLEPGLKPEPGDPKPGKPQPGDPQPGEPQPGDPQPGDPQPGEPQQGDPAGQPQGTGDKDGSEAPSEQVGSQGEPDGQHQAGDPDSQLRGDESQTGTGSLDEPGSEDPTASTGSERAFSGDPTHDGPVSDTEARRLLEGVKEGRPRLDVLGEDGDKPW